MPKMHIRLLLLVFASVVCETISHEEPKGLISNMFNRRTTTIGPLVERRICDCMFLVVFLVSHTSPRWLDHLTCGERNDASRIVGGEATLSNEFPWMVRLSYFNRFYCGGMLINDRYVLTAAHCVRGFIWFMIKVTLGEHDRCDKTKKPETRFVIRAFSGDFTFLNFDHDIAILRMNDRVPVNTEVIRPICLPSNTEQTYEGTKAIATGWGTLREDGQPSCLLQEVEVPVMNNADCRTNTSYTPTMISDNMMCAGYDVGLKDSCQGDSGGPLIREREDGRFELIGVVSWGNGCARPGSPGVYTRVARYIDWINKHAGDGCFCVD